MKFNAEFSHQAIDFPIKWRLLLRWSSTQSNFILVTVIWKHVDPNHTQKNTNCSARVHGNALVYTFVGFLCIAAGTNTD